MFKNYFIGIIALFVLFGCEPSKNQESDLPAENEIGLLFSPAQKMAASGNLNLMDYWSKIESTLTSSLPVVLLTKPELEDENQQLAQNMAIRNASFLRDINKRGSGEPLHTEMMSVRPASSAELLKDEVQATLNVYRVEMYNFYYNTSTIAYVDVKNRRIIKVKHSTSTPNEINENLRKLAKNIALSSKEVLDALGCTKMQANSLPYHLNTTKCERSRHLCSAPTFRKGNKELWVIVDLTDLDVVGYDWVASNPNRPQVVTERSLQNEFVVEKFCGTDTQLKKGDWNITYTLTGSDGLEIKNVTFQEQPVLATAKIVDWHVTYDFKKGFGYSDAIGCPMFSAAAVVAFNGPEVRDIKQNGEVVGFALVQDFRSPVWPLACNYRYQNRFEFYQDGRFRVAGVNLGLGCGKGGWYRPVFRMALAAGGAEGQTVSRWEQGQWAAFDKEAWFLQDEKTTYSPEGYLYQIKTGQNKGFYLEPGNGQFGDGGRGDNAYTYITVDHKSEEEGAGNMPTIGSCCNTDYQQGPEEFLTPPESLKGQDLIIWYVPQMPNDDTPGKEYCWVIPEVQKGREVDVTYAGIVGPMFVPISMKK